MTLSLHECSVGIFTEFLHNLSVILDRASAYAVARQINQSVSLDARLYPNMFNLASQVQEANRHAIIACALLSGVNPPVFGDHEPDFPQLQSQIEAAISFMQGLLPNDVNGAAEKEVVFTFRNGSTRKFIGKSLLLTFSVPQFFFHVSTAYDILRHNGLDLSKKDFLGLPNQG